MCERIAGFIMHHISFVEADNIADRLVFISQFRLTLAGHEVQTVDRDLQLLNDLFDFVWDVEEAGIQN